MNKKSFLSVFWHSAIQQMRQAYIIYNTAVVFVIHDKICCLERQIVHQQAQILLFVNPGTVNVVSSWQTKISHT